VTKKALTIFKIAQKILKLQLSKFAKKNAQERQSVKRQLRGITICKICFKQQFQRKKVAIKTIDKICQNWIHYNILQR